MTADESILEEELRADLGLLEANPGNSALLARIADSFGRLGRYADAQRHFELLCRIKPDDAQAWRGLGAAAGLRGDLLLGVHAFEKSIALGRDDASGRAQLANYLQQLGRVDEAIAQAELAMTMGPTPKTLAWIHCTLGTCYRALRDTRLQNSHYRKAVRADPRNAYARHVLGFVLWEQGRLHEAIRHFRKAVELDPKDGELWAQLGHALIAAENFAEARAALHRAVETGANGAETTLDLAIAELFLGSLSQARERAQQAIARQPSPEVFVRAQKTLAMVAIEQKSWKAAAAHLSRALEVDADDPSAHYRLGEVRREQKQSKQALNHFEAAARLAPDNADYWYTVGFHRARAGKLGPAREALEKAIELGYDEVTAAIQLTDVLLRMDRFREARDTAERALKLSTSDYQTAWLYALAGDCYARESLPEKAIQSYRKAVRLDPDDGRSHYKLADLYLTRGDFARARPHSVRAATLDPQNPDAWKALGFAASGMGDYPAAKPALEKALALDNRDVSTRRQLVSVLIDLGDFEAALRQARQAVETDPEHAGAHFNLSLILGELDDLNQALHHAERAAELRPEPKFVRWQGQLHLECGKPEAAERVLRSVLGVID